MRKTYVYRGGQFLPEDPLGLENLSDEQEGELLKEKGFEFMRTAKLHGLDYSVHWQDQHGWVVFIGVCEPFGGYIKTFGALVVPSWLDWIDLLNKWPVLRPADVDASEDQPAFARA
jgi:hypothetical protein